MSQLVITEAGRLRLIETQLQFTGAPVLDLAVFLYNNDITPTRATLLADLVEATTTEGITPLPSADWQAPTIVANNATSINGVLPYTFTGATGPQTIYGYAVVDIADDTLLWAERVDTPFALVVTQEVKVVPRYVFGSIYDPAP